MNAQKNKSDNRARSKETKLPAIILFGTDALALPVLRALYDAGYPVKLVVTKPDEPAGRHQTLTAPPIKQLAKELGLPVWQPKKYDTIEPLKETNAELYILVAYGKLLPNEVLALPSLGVVNVHPSLLPLYRGPSPVQTALLNGEKETGVTIMLLDKGMDSGPILAQVRVLIEEQEKSPELSERLFDAGAKLLIKTLPDYISGALAPKPQDESRATYCSIIKRENGLIDWHKSAREIYNQFRAFTPWPGVFTFFTLNGKKTRIKLLEISAQQKNLNVTAGTIITHNKLHPIDIACSQGFIQIHRLQLEGGKPLTDEEFLNGFGGKLSLKLDKI
ncbi:MAG: methionyl-tRNA formyltransferase [Candidatus Magasanikbacteria bacterium]|nr:methionyl-tRNA formyltransferase [Candidatus Magasanikbacteria bacterium]